MTGTRGYSPERVLAAAQAIVGPAAARLARDDVPGWPVRLVVVEPADEAALGAVLEWAARDRLPVVPCGGGSKLGWGAAPPAGAILLSVARLDRLLDHREGDLTVTAHAGVRLAALNEVLSARGQHLPLDPPHGDRATLGGIVATNDSGPLRHRWGTPRDLIIGAEFVRADGARAKAGGIVVKNVAGYDIARLLTGSFGTLAVLTSVGFKLAPLPPDSATVVVRPPTEEALDGMVQALRTAPGTPDAVEIDGPEWRLLVRFASVPASVREQADAVVRLAGVHHCEAVVVRAEEEQSMWRGRDAEIWSGDAAVARLATPPAGLLPAVRAMGARCEQLDTGWRVAGRALAGVVLLRLDGPSAAVAQAVTSSRQRLASGCGSLTVLRMPAALRGTLDPWGVVEPAGVMRAIKQQMDPLALLAPGHGPGGL